MDREDSLPLTHLLDDLERTAEARTVSVNDVLTGFGDRAITPFMLILSLLLISPLSGIPGVPTVSALIMITLAVQALIGRRRLWLPGFLLRREISGARLRTGVKWLRKPCAFVDRHSHPRLKLLTVGPMRYLTLLALVVIPMGWPFLEVLPMVTTVGAATVGLMTFGLFIRDGLYVLLGYGMVGLTLGTVLYFIY